MIPLLVIIGLLGASALLLGAEEPTDASPREQAPLPKWQGPPSSMKDAEARQAFLRQLRPDASVYADGYSFATYYVEDANGAWVPSDASRMYVMYVDEWGRRVSGQSGDPLGIALQAAGIALPFVPGVGPAASAALAMAIALGKGESLKDAAMKAARAALPGGAAAQMAFDVGVAVASGELVDEAAKNALLDEIPGGKEAYEQGQAAWDMAKGMGA